MKNLNIFKFFSTIKLSKNIFLSIISGVLLSLSFYSDNFSLLSFISIVPIFYLILNNEIKTKYLFSFYFSFYLGLMTWLFKLYPMSFLGIKPFESIILLTLGWFTFSFVESLIFVLFGFIFLKIKFISNELKALAFVPLFLLIEWTQGLSDAGLTWGRLGISQYKNLLFIQSSNIFGTLFIDSLILFINLFLSILIFKVINKKSKINIKKYLIIPITILFNIFYGFYTINSKDDSYKDIKVGIVQGNIASGDKWNMPYTKILEIYTDLTNKMVYEYGKQDIILWPESVSPMPLSKNYLKSDPLSLKTFKNIAIKNNSDFITGILTTSTNYEDFLYKELENRQNSMVYINKNGDFSEFYSKRHLVPFGEYIPFGDLTRKFVPMLSKLNALKQDVIAGEKAVTFETKFGKVGAIICYESIFPSIVSSNITLDAQLIAISTNDSWFKDSSAVYQHNAQAVLRAIENNRFIIRAANTGISSIIDNKGNIIKYIPPLESGYISDNVKFLNTKTIYSITGDYPIIIISLFYIFYLSRKRNKVPEI